MTPKEPLLNEASPQKISHFRDAFLVSSFPSLEGERRMQMTINPIPMACASEMDSPKNRPNSVGMIAEREIMTVVYESGPVAYALTVMLEKRILMSPIKIPTTKENMLKLPMALEQK